MNTTNQTTRDEIARMLNVGSGGARSIDRLAALFFSQRDEVTTKARTLLGDAVPAEPSAAELLSIVKLGTGLSSNAAARLTRRVGTLSDIEQRFDSLFMGENEPRATTDSTLSRAQRLLIARGLWALDDWQRTVAETPLTTEQRSSFTETMARRILSGRDPVSLVFFVCPPQEFGFLQSDTPERYFAKSFTAQSFLGVQRGRLENLFSTLDRVRVRYSVDAVVGDCDEDDYIWPVLGVPSNLDRSLVDERREILREDAGRFLVGSRILPAERLAVWSMRSMFAAQDPARVDEWSNLAARTALEDREAIGREVGRMRELWTGEAPYYEGLPEPDEAAMRRIVELKFAAYAREGVLLGERFPEAILIQTERPPLLRTAMLNMARVRAGLDPLEHVMLNKPEN